MNDPQLSPALKGKLGLYTALAASAGVTSVASAQVVYSGVQNVPVDATAPVFVDVTGDGFDNFAFVVDSFSGQPLLSILGLNTDGGTPPNPFEVVIVEPSVPGGYPYAVNFDAGALIQVGDPSNTLSDGATIIYANLGNFQEPNNNGFIGVSVPVVEVLAGVPTVTSLVNGYIQISNVTDTSMTIVDWAYETDPLSGITAGAVPEPGSLGALAIGALAMIRRKRTAA